MRLAKLTLATIARTPVYVNPADVVYVSHDWLANPPRTTIGLRGDDNAIYVIEPVDEAAAIIMACDGPMPQ
jgi:hypothetical protein